MGYFQEFWNNQPTTVIGVGVGVGVGGGVVIVVLSGIYIFLLNTYK